MLTPPIKKCMLDFLVRQLLDDDTDKKIYVDVFLNLYFLVR